MATTAGLNMDLWLMRSCGSINVVSEKKCENIVKKLKNYFFLVFLYILLVIVGIFLFFLWGRYKLETIKKI
ncbi:UNVERIFIED_CONTAM: hypothetical protein DVV46_10810 [Lactobacillus paragasseri]|nr:hypothetical protein [Lactobacillus paragasseri]